jgi:hypothetical protein
MKKLLVIKAIILIVAISFIALFSSCSTDEQQITEETTYQAKIYYEGASCEVWINQTKIQFTGSTLKTFVKKNDVITILVQGKYVDNSNNYNAPDINIPAKVTLELNNVVVANGTTRLFYHFR